MSSAQPTITTINPNDSKNSEIDCLMFTKFALASSESFIEYGPEKYFLPKKYLQHIEEVLNMEVYDDDIWLTSFPRTGTTWSQEMISSITTRNFDEKNLREIFPFLEISAVFSGDLKEVMEDGTIMKPAYLNDSVNYVKTMKRPRLIKTHLPWEFLPTKIQTGERKPKIIYVSRNSKDVCCSYFHFYYLLSGKCCGNLNEFAQLFLNNRVIFGPFWTHIKNFRKHATNRLNIMFITYEEMYENIREVIRKVSEFLHVELSEQEIEKLIRNLSFQKMKSNRKLNAVEERDGHGTGEFFRKGQVGQYKTDMSADVIKLFDERDLELTNCT